MAHGTKTKGASSTGESRVRAGRWRPRVRRSFLAALVVAIAHLPSSAPALADDFERLLRSAGSDGTVSALVTGWRPVTGDEAARGSRGNGLVAITGDEFVKRLEGTSARVAVTRRYENFPVLAMEMDRAALRAAKEYGGTVEVFDDPVLEPLLDESASLVGAPRAWRRGYAGRGLAVAVIDDGADTRHPFLAGRTVFEACFADVCPNGRPEMIGPGAALPAGSHGTHVAGIALGGAVDEDLAGVGPELRLIIISVANRSRRGMSGRNILAALDVVITLARRYPGVIGAVNMSLGASRDEPGVCPSRVWDLASRLFREVGVPVVVASGNDSEEDRAAPVGFPACVEGFVSVGAVTKGKEVASFSNSGPTLDLLAPGVDIQSSVVKDEGGGRLERGFDSWPGTSMAAPHVAGAFAVLKQASPHSSVEELLRVLESTGPQIPDRRSGGRAARLIDVGAAIERLGPAAAGSSAVPVPQLTLEPKPGGSPGPKPEPAPGPGTEPAKEKKEWKAITG